MSPSVKNLVLNKLHHQLWCKKEFPGFFTSVAQQSKHGGPVSSTRVFKSQLDEMSYWSGTRFCNDAIRGSMNAWNAFILSWVQVWVLLALDLNTCNWKQKDDIWLWQSTIFKWSMWCIWYDWIKYTKFKVYALSRNPPSTAANSTYSYQYFKKSI